MTDGVRSMASDGTRPHLTLTCVKLLTTQLPLLHEAMKVPQPEKLPKNFRTESYTDRELRRANHPPAESYGVPAPYPTPLATHRALQGGMARAARHRDSPIPHGDREAG